MVPLGALLLVLAVAFGAGFLVSPGESADIHFYGLMLKNLSARSLVVLGIITGLIAASGAESIRWGTARWRRRRRIARKKERELGVERARSKAAAFQMGDAAESTVEVEAAASQKPPSATVSVTESEPEQEGSENPAVAEK